MTITFGKKLKQLREFHKLTLREVARKTDLTSGYLSLLENEKQIGFPSEDTIRRIAEIYTTDPDELILLSGRLPQDEYENVKNARLSGITKSQLNGVLNRIANHG